MNRKGPDLRGSRFGLLTVVHRERSFDNRARWMCKCACGCRIITRTDVLMRGQAKSCGCAGRRNQKAAVTKHGLHKTRVYHSWQAMVRRCRDPRVKAFKDYGGRGITVCDAWAAGFVAFFEYVGHPPEGHSLERIDNERGYEPGNVRWATAKEQARNRRCTKYVVVNGVRMPLAAAAESAGIAYSTALGRLARGLPVDEALKP